MPDTVEKRIVIAVEAGEALASLGKVKGSTDQLIRAKREELKISRAKANFDKAEAASATAAQRAYNAELARERKLKELAAAKKRGAEAGEIRRLTGEVKQLTNQYKKLAQAEDMANSRAKLAKQQMDAANASAVNFANKQQGLGFFGRGFFGQFIARQLGIPLVAGGSGMGSFATVAAAGFAVSSVSNLIGKIQSLYDYRQKAEIGYKEVSAQGEEWAIGLDRQRIQKTEETINAISRLNAVEKLNNQQKLEMIRLVETLGGAYGKYGIEIDETTGKVKNLSDLLGKSAEEVRKKQIELIDREIMSLRGQRDVYDETTNRAESWWRHIGNPGLAAAADEALAKTIAINQKLTELQIQRSDLIDKDPSGDAEKKRIALLKDQKELYDNEFHNLLRQKRLQELVNDGLEREAALQGLRWEWIEKRQKFIAGSEEQKQFDAAQQRLIAERMSIFDDRQSQAIRRARERIDAADALRFAPRLQNMTARSVRAESIEGMRLMNRAFSAPVSVADKQLTEAKKQTELLERVYEVITLPNGLKEYHTMSFGG